MNFYENTLIKEVSKFLSPKVDTECHERSKPFLEVEGSVIFSVFFVAFCYSFFLVPVFLFL